jgi:polar amino acid transport system substrate-binding protein
VVNFTQPYLAGGLVALVKEGNSTINSAEDLKGKKISVQTGTKSVEWLHTHIPDAQTVEVEKPADVQPGQHWTRGCSDRQTCGVSVCAHARRGQDPAGSLTSEESGIAVRKDEAALVGEMNDALKQLKADGSYQQLVDKWFRIR